MELSLRAVRVLGRFFRSSSTISCRYIGGVPASAVNQEVNTELLTAFNNDINEGGVVPVFRRALLFPTRVALQDEVGIYTYAGLHQAASQLSKEIGERLQGDSEKTIAYMCRNDASHIIVQWAIWMTGNIAVPLTPLHPAEMLKYFVQDSSASLVICTPEYENTLRPITAELSKSLLVTGREKEMTAQLYQPNSLFLKPKPEESLNDVGKANAWYGRNDALLIYTSGTTSKPKGVVWTHSMLASQIASLHAAWRYSSRDVVLHALPLHHIHGQLNSLLASLAAGARIRMLPTFVSHTVWARLLGMGEREESRVTVFHGVPAMYARLAGDHARMFSAARTREHVRATLAARLRLMCAGSAPLPAPLFQKWEEVSDVAGVLKSSVYNSGLKTINLASLREINNSWNYGPLYPLVNMLAARVLLDVCADSAPLFQKSISGHRLLERYGMSEVGMALSNPYRPVGARTLGCVGGPLPGVQARLAADAALITVSAPPPDTEISLEKLGLSQADGEDPPSESWQAPTVTIHKPSDDGVYQGELLLKGPGVFKRYFNRTPKPDDSDFTSDGWFRTGDTASFSENRFRILGRTSVDIIKTAGYKVSALQVESAILEHPSIADAAVLGIEDETYGETISAVVVLKEQATLTLAELKEEVGKKLAPYQLPRNMLVVQEMPRNVMGKLDKKQIRKLYGDALAVKS